MSAWLIAICGVIYFGVSIEQAYKGNIGLFITYLSYATANIGLYIVASK